jgi:hypothetical protein
MEVTNSEKGLPPNYLRVTVLGMRHQGEAKTHISLEWLGLQINYNEAVM